MSVNKLLGSVAVGLVGVATVIAAIGLLHELTTAADPHALMHELEGWLMNVVYHLALIVLAAAGVNYLASKK